MHRSEGDSYQLAGYNSEWLRFAAPTFLFIIVENAIKLKLPHAVDSRFRTVCINPNEETGSIVSKRRARLNEKNERAPR